MTNTLTYRPSPLSEYERRIIASAASQAVDINVISDDIWTIHTDRTTGTFWLHLRDGKQLPFALEQFRSAIDQAKKDVAVADIATRSSRKVARELEKGDRVKIANKVWTITSINSCQVGGRKGRSAVNAIKFNVALFDGVETKLLTPYSEANFELAA